VTDVARVRAAQDAREAAGVGRLQHQADHADPVAQEPIHRLGEVRQLVDQQDVYFCALVLVDVFLVFAVAEVNLAAVPEADFILDDRHELARHPAGEHGAEALGAFHVVLDQIVADPAEQVDLQARDGRAPQDGRDTHQVRLAAAGRAAVQHFGRDGLQRLALFGVERQVELGVEHALLRGGESGLRLPDEDVQHRRQRLAVRPFVLQRDALAVLLGRQLGQAPLQGVHPQAVTLQLGGVDGPLALDR
jgi:hypothetical protein